MSIKCVLYINICCFLGLYFSYHTTLHTRIANNPVFFDGSRKFSVAFGLSGSDACKAKFPQSLSKQDSAVHVDTICGPLSKLLFQAIPDVGGNLFSK